MYTIQTFIAQGIYVMLDYQVGAMAAFTGCYQASSAALHVGIDMNSSSVAELLHCA